MEKIFINSVLHVNCNYVTILLISVLSNVKKIIFLGITEVWDTAKYARGQHFRMKKDNKMKINPYNYYTNLCRIK